MIKLVICDIDGTIVDKNRNIDSGLIDVVDKLRSNKISFTLASGRNFYMMQELIEKFNIKIPYISDNGANIYESNKKLLSYTIKKEYNGIILENLIDNDIPFIAYSNKGFYINSLNEKLLGFAKLIKAKVKSFKANKDIDDDFYKITMDFSGKDVSLVKELNNFNFKRSEGNLYTITDENASKGNGVISICKLLKLEKDEIMVIGDNYNDLSMFDVAGVSVCMSESSDAIKKKTDYIAGSNNDNGVSKFLKEYFRNKGVL